MQAHFVQKNRYTYMYAEDINMFLESKSLSHTRSDFVLIPIILLNLAQWQSIVSQNIVNLL